MLDLSNIPALELPEKKEKIKICGVEKEVTFVPVVGDKRLELFALLAYDERPIKELLPERVMLALECGVGMSKEDVRKLIHIDWQAALNLTGAVISHTLDYEQAYTKEEEKAEKNSAPEGQTHTAP